MRSHKICTYLQISLGRSSHGERGGRGIWHAWERRVYKDLVGKPEGKNHSEDRDVDAIRMDPRETGWGCRVNTVGSGQRPIAGSCEYGDEPSSSCATG
jgi:hypothetical protein